MLRERMTVIYYVENYVFLVSLGYKILAVRELNAFTLVRRYEASERKYHDKVYIRALQCHLFRGLW
jgi:hypothetical protein